VRWADLNPGDRAPADPADRDAARRQGRHRHAQDREVPADGVLDGETTDLVKARRDAQFLEKLAAGSAWEDADLVFCDEIGRVYPPDRVSAWFRQAAAKARLRVIKLHEGRHSAASLGFEAGLDIKAVSAQLGHSNTAITADLYTHMRQQIADRDAESVAALIPRRAVK
jgi:integrase